MSKTWWPIGILVVCTFACRHDQAVSKPRAYPRVEYPEHSFKTYAEPACPFTFRYPGYAEITDKPGHACWFDLSMPVFKARLHCSYLPVSDRSEFDKLVRDAYTIAAKINERANYMEESRLENSQHVGGIALHWTGPAASPFHFFLSDTTRHFFKASLYFEAEVRPDSLAPIIQFVEQDLDSMVQSFAWRKSE